MCDAKNHANTGVFPRLPRYKDRPHYV